NADNINAGGTHLLDVGIGRIPAGNDAQARAIVDKITGYHAPSSLGPWRTELTYIADDEDNNLHLQDAETITGAVTTITQSFNQDKIYLDAYQQESGPAGSRYPLVNQAIINRMFSGNLIWNYTGHGGARRLADEVVLDQDIINSFSNAGKLPLYITATCDFAPHDNPLVASIGENLLLRERTGAIALMTTTRLVFAYSNRVMNENYLKAALQRNSNGRYPTLGDAVRSAKNTTYTNFSDVINNRKFTLIGDPALTIGYPVQQVRTTAVNGVPVTTVPDTLKALSTYAIAGEVISPQGALMADFNGTVYPVIFDKVQNVTTLANDAGSVKTTFPQQKNIIFRGKATVTNGKFNFNFVVPKDIDYKFGNGRISYYTENGSTDGAGATTDLIVGGTGSGNDDKAGPELKPFLNDEKFIDGGVTIPGPMFILRLSDSSGINVMGSGTGHDLVVMIDNDPSRSYILNEFYTSSKDDHRSGEVRFQFPDDLEEGVHTLTVKAWDVMNNSSEATLGFRVQKEEGLKLEHVLNYPNPFTTRTTFWFDHNRPGDELQVSISIFTVTGKLVKTIRNTILSPGTRSNEIEWNARDEFGSKIGRGVYIYRLTVRTSDGHTAHQMQKLYIL
ncbi:MAG: type IX secretion system sortase PorU, partial [Pedobacter sp.]